MRTLILSAALLIATPLVARAQQIVQAPQAQSSFGKASVPTLRRPAHVTTRKGTASIFSARLRASRNGHFMTGRELRARSVKKVGR